MKEARAQLGTEASERPCMSTWYSCSSITFALQVSGILGTSSPAVFAKTSPGSSFTKICEPEVPKHRQARISPKSPKSWHLWRVRGHSCWDFGDLEEIQAWRCFGISSFTNCGEIRARQCFRIRGCQNIVRLEFEPGSVFASKVAKTSPGSNFPNIYEAGSAKTSPGSSFPQIPNPKSWHLWGAWGHSCWDFGDFGELRAWRCFRSL